MTVPELIERFQISDAGDGTLAVYACVTSQQAEMIRDAKPQILAYLQQRRKAVSETAQTRRACADNIPGVKELRAAKASPLPPALDSLEKQYPDAAFVLALEAGQRDPCYEYAAICHRSYRSICSGEDISNVKIRHEKEMAAFLRQHIWD